MRHNRRRRFSPAGVVAGLLLAALARAQSPIVAGPPPLATPDSLQVDAPAAGLAVSGNGVLEWNEIAVVVNPGWTSHVTTGSVTGTILNPRLEFPLLDSGGADGGFPPLFTIVDSNADYGVIAGGASGDCLHSTGDCYAVSLSGTRPAQHVDALVDEIATFFGLGNPEPVSTRWRMHVGESFADVSDDLALDPFYPAIETLFHRGVTSGCHDGTVFCPLQSSLRQEVAVFLLKTFPGSTYVPPPCTPPGVFADVPCPGLYTDWIEDLKARGITAGCGDGTVYCPEAALLRQEMAVFLLETILGPNHVPPPCTPPGVFTDVACPGPYADWIEELKTRGITAGCGDGSTFCPEAPVTREEMAALLTRTFGLTLYGPF